MIWRTLSLLTDGYGNNADVTALLDETEIWMVPQINPDGFEADPAGLVVDLVLVALSLGNLHRHVEELHVAS